MLGDFKKFINALDNGACVNLRRDKYSVFELACKTPGRKRFIDACLKRDVRLDEKNPETYEYPIHLAARSFDSENLSQLLEDQRINVDQKFEDRTALYLLLEQIDTDNRKEVFECIKLLLKYHANINATDENSVSPIALLVTAGNDAWRKEILDYCLQNYSVNVDFDQNHARKAIEKHFPGTPIPDIDMEKVTVEILRNKLAAGTVEDFLAAYEKYISQIEDHVLREEDCVELLSVAVNRAKLIAAQKLLEGQMADGKFVGKPALLSGLLAKCCNRGNVPILEWLLSIIPPHEVKLINEDPLLSLLVKQIDEYKDKNKCRFIESMGILLNDPRIEVDKIDVKRYTAMHYAVKYKIDHAQELLLAKGAYIGGEDLFGDSPISEMDSFLLEKHLDSCVTDNDRKPGDEDYEVRINFSNFIPPHRKIQTNYDEMQPIVTIAQTASKKQLLWHPVVASILLLKWIQLTRLFYVNLGFSVLFTISLMYMVFFLDQGDDPFKLFFYIASIVGWIYLIVRELIQLTVDKWMYFLSIENLLELVLISVSGAMLFWHLHYPAVLVSVILSLGLELTLQIAMIPVDTISTYMAMLKTVSKNFLKCLAVCSILLLAFTFSFYTVFRIPASTGLNETADNKTINMTVNDGERFNQFQELPLAFIKTAVMLTGEFEAANMNYKISWVICFLFLLFVFFVAIVMSNLMSGVAVSDTAAIQAESETIGLKKMVFVICKYEKALKMLNANRFLSKTSSWLIPSKSLQLFHKNEPLKDVFLQPSKPRVIEYETSPSKPSSCQATVENGSKQYEALNSTESPRNPYTYNTNHCYYKPFSVMLDKIVKSSRRILNSHQTDVGSIANYMSRLEQRLETMAQEQKELRKNVLSLTENELKKCHKQ
ncbi:transient receptor potential cation channel protein painless-like [Anopheles marshallii]|uniref:transient receptor potential cation channel protein painless-like n=1 Tax=Anopheles marshallii TaxID=1521116 RepID=UPI00237B6CDD|nr:transient receptor potential cation channel protein painless-like [Anopheles marshallii]